MKRCEQCEKEIDTDRKHPWQKYCGAACRVAAHRRRGRAAKGQELAEGSGGATEPEGRVRRAVKRPATPIGSAARAEQRTPAPEIFDPFERNDAETESRQEEMQRKFLESMEKKKK